MAKKSSSLPAAFFTAALFLASPLVSQEAWAYAFQETRTRVEDAYFFNGTYDTGVQASSVQVDSQNYAKANLGFGTVGAGVSLNNTNPNAINARASSEWYDTWSSSNVLGVSSIGISRFKADGILSSALYNALMNQTFGGLFNIAYTYNFGNQFIRLDIDYDGSWSSPISARWGDNSNGTEADLSSYLTWGTNQAGDFTFSLIYHPSLIQSISCLPGICNFDEFMKVEMKLEYTDSITPGTLLAADFLHTFSVDLQSNDTWTSELGRTITPTGPGSPVSEPGTLALLSMSAAILGFTRRRSRPA